jgi:D-lyxose ketol-isomerase
VLTQAELSKAQSEGASELARAGLVLTAGERERLEVADFGLSDFARFGLTIVTYVNTERVCAKELVMSAGQICPEHLHPSRDGVPGKEETFRCRAGMVRIYVEGEPTVAPRHDLTPREAENFTVFHEIELRPGEQHTLLPDTRHWFQAGPDGAIVSEFSTTSTDDLDIFTDPRIVRQTRVTEVPS